MALPKYSDAIKDPFFTNASVEEKIALNDKYWNAYRRENPGDKWGESQAQASRRVLESTAALDSADPLSKRALEFQRDLAETQLVVNNLDADGGWESPQQREQMVSQRKAELEAKRQQLDKTFSLFKPEVAKEMEPTWKALDRFASDSGYFGGESGLKGAATLAGDIVTFGHFSEKADDSKVRYEKLRDTVAKDFNLAPEEVDDVMRHRLDKYDGELSRDAFGTLHFKDSALVKNTDEIEDIVAKSNLPDQVKSKAKEEVPQRVALFKEGVVQTAKQNFPELAKELDLGDDINENYRKIVDATNKSRAAQAGSGLKNYIDDRVVNVAVRGVGLFSDKIIAPVRANVKGFEDSRNYALDYADALDAEVKANEGIASLSDKIQQDKVRIWGTDAATVGQGGASVLESIALVTLTGGAGNLVKAERIARAGAAGKLILGGVKAGLTVAPTAAIYGGEKALDTWEQASQSDDPAIRARAGELATKDFLGEFAITTGMSMIGLGGAERIGAALATRGARQAFAKSISGVVGKVAVNFGVNPVAEAFEESLITAIETIHVQQQLNPDMTDEQVRSSIKDTIVSTLIATGGVAGPKGTIDLIGDIKNLSTQDKTTEELHDATDAIYTARATQENLPETETEGRAFPASGTVSLAEIERERAAQIELTEDPEEKKTLAEATPEELAGEWGVELMAEESQEPGAADNSKPKNQEKFSVKLTSGLKVDVEAENAQQAEDLAKAKSGGFAVVRGSAERITSDDSKLSEEQQGVKVTNLDDILKQGGGTVEISENGRQVKFDQFGIIVDGNTAEVAFVELDSSERGKGVGLKAYKALGEALAAKGITLQSSKAQYANGREMWMKLANEGYATKGAQGVFYFKSRTETKAKDETENTTEIVNPSQIKVGDKVKLGTRIKTVTAVINQGGGKTELEFEGGSKLSGTSILDVERVVERTTTPTAEAAVPTEPLPEGQAPPAEEAGGVASVIPDEGNAPKAKEVVQKFLTPEAQALPPESFKQQKVASPEQVSLQNSVAKMYDALPEDDSSNPEVVKGYENLTTEVLDQHKAMLDSGLEIELVSENPYASSKEMVEDVKRGKLKVQRTDPQTFGSSPEAFTAGNHPMLKDSGLKDVNGQPMLVNDVFRGVHDYIAHAAFGSTFGPLGEEAAWKAHLATIKDPLARRALTTETRGQNSWVNYRDEMLRDGKPIKKGEPGYVSPQDRPFATQKFALLPEEALQEVGTKPQTQSAPKPTQQPEPQPVATDKTEDIDVASEETVRAVNNAVLEALGLTAEEAQGITGEDVLSQEPEQSPAPKGQVTFRGLSEAFITYMKNADGSTAVHEPIHVARRFLLNRAIPADKRLGVTDEMIDAANEFVGAKDSNWTVEQEEKFARAFERYLWEGAETGNAKVDSVFSKIRDLLRKVYSAIEGSSLNVELTPEIKKLFGQLITRGETLKEQGVAPTAIPLKVEVKGKAQAKPIRKKTTRKVPAPTPFGVKREDLDKARKKYGIPEQPGMVVRMTDEEAFDEAYALMAKHDKGEDVLVGQQLVLNLMEDNRGTNKVEVALLAIHGFEIQKGLKDLENKIAKLDPAETQKRKAFETLQEALLNDFQDLVNVTQLQGSRAGLALQAMKLVADQVYSLDAMLRRRAIWKNSGNKGESKPLTAAEVRETEKQSEKIQKLIEERDRLMKELEGKYTLKEAQAILEAAGKKLAKEKPVRRTALTERASAVATSARDRLRAMGLGKVTLNQMAGEKAVLPQFQRDSLDTARAMAAAGKTSEEIRAVTGWFPGKYDGKMRWEIPDSGAEVVGIKPEAKTSLRLLRKGTKLKNILKHPNLFAAYPELGEVVVMRGKKLPAYMKGKRELGSVEVPPSGAVFIPKQKLMTFETDIGSPYQGPVIGVSTGVSASEFKNSLLHEIQHWIQEKENFAVGSEDEGGAYDMSAGEIEARDVEARANMTPEQLAATAPYSSENIAEEDAITLFQEEENTQVEILDAISDVGVEYLANGAKKLDAFTEKVVSEFGEEFRSEAQTIFGMAQEKYKKLASNARQKTPQELASLIDPTKDISERMVYNMVLGFLRQPNGPRGAPAVLDAVTELLKKNGYPDLAREEVVVAFTGYGKILIPSQEQIKKDMRELRTVERLNAQLADIAKGLFPKKTGLQRDKTTSPVRSLMKQIEQAMIDAGMNYTDEQDKKTRLAGARDHIKRQIENQIADMDNAIKEGVRIDRTKRDPVTDKILEDLKKQRDNMKKRYDAIFGIDAKKISVEAQIKKASKMLDRQITLLEAEARGEILNNPKKVKLDSPELKAKRERLESLREAKRAAAEALNPKKTAAELATDRLRRGAERSIERFEYFIKNGTYPPKADGTPATIDDVMRDLLATRDRLRDTVREIQKDRRILTPPEVIARNRAIRQLNKTITDLEGRIARRDFSKRAKKPESTDPAVRNLKATVASLRETLDQIKRDTLKPISPEEKRIQRMIAASKKRKENYEKRLAAGDFAKTVKRDTKEDSRLTAVKIEEAKAKAEWLEEGRKYALENMTATQRFWHRVKSAAMIRKIVTLGAEYGIAFRQLLFFTYRFWINPKVVTRTFIKAFSAGFSRDKEIEYYNEIIDRPNSVYDKRMKMPFISPFADIERMQEMDAVDPDVLEKLNAKIPKWIPLRWATEFMLSVERFNRVSTNVTRAYMADNLINKGVRDPGNPTKDELAVIGNAVLAATGRGSLGDGKLDAGLALLNTVTISARYAVSRAQMTALQPLWTTAGTWKGTGKIRAHIAADIYGKALVGRVLVGHIIAGIIQAALPDEEEEDIEWNPTSSRFGGISYKGTIIELNGGARAYINLLAQGIMGYKLNSKGERIPLRGEGSIGFGKRSWRDELYSFVRNRENINMAMIIDTIEQQHFGDIPMTKTSFTRQLLEPIIVEDMVNIFETHGIRDGAVLATAMFFGVGVRTPWEKTEKKEPELNWIRF